MLPTRHTLTIRTGGVALAADLAVPDGAAGVIVFAHGSGSSRMSPRNRYVADALLNNGFATVLFDLLAPDEPPALRFDIEMLADRLTGVVAWIAPQLAPIGLFGASTGAGAALIAATRAREVAAVVSRGGRPDLAADWLPGVDCPTLLVAGSNDHEVLALNRRALQRLNAASDLHVVLGAGHLFEEPGALDEVVSVATLWFRKHLAAPDALRPSPSPWP